MNLARRVIRADLRFGRRTHPTGTTDEKGNLLNRHERRALSAKHWREYWRSVGRALLRRERNCAYFNRCRLYDDGGPYLASLPQRKKRRL